MNNLKYTTEKIKAELEKDETISKEEKEAELAKPVVSDDAFALCDLIHDLIKKIEQTRVALL
jgi:hypothetical protein